MSVNPMKAVVIINSSITTPRHQTSSRGLRYQLLRGVTEQASAVRHGPQQDAD